MKTPLALALFFILLVLVVFYYEGDLHNNFSFIVELSLHDIFLFLWNLPLIFYALAFLFFYLTWPRGLLKGLIIMFKNL